MPSPEYANNPCSVKRFLPTESSCLLSRHAGRRNQTSADGNMGKKHARREISHYFRSGLRRSDTGTAPKAATKRIDRQQ